MEVVTEPDGLLRCSWCNNDPLLSLYHDEEWGVPVHDDKKHFEFLVLETSQAGLSWLTILRKRERYRTVFKGFDPEVVASFGEPEVRELLSDPGIIRNERKIRAAINNAARFLEVQGEHGSFDTYMWNWVAGRPVVNSFRSIGEIPVTTDLSDEVSADLKKRGFSFIGSTTIYAHLQAIGVVNDHLVDCFRHPGHSSTGG